jgi:O-acetyl-ADP-ribose deacetylase
LLASCYQSALRLAEEKEISSIALPAISTGIFGYPMDLAAKVAFSTIVQQAPTLKHVKKIRFVLHNIKDLEVHENVLKEF